MPDSSRGLEARERFEVEELCAKGRAVVEEGYEAELLSLKEVEADERAQTQTIIDRAIRHASRRALADSHATRERERMHVADDASWALL